MIGPSGQREYGPRRGRARNLAASLWRVGIILLDHVRDLLEPAAALVREGQKLELADRQAQISRAALTCNHLRLLDDADAAQHGHNLVATRRQRDLGTRPAREPAR